MFWEGYMAEYPTEMWWAAVSDYAGSHTTAELAYLAKSISELACAKESDTEISNGLIAAGIPLSPEECRAWLTLVAQRLRDKALEASKARRRQ